MKAIWSQAQSCSGTEAQGRDVGNPDPGIVMPGSAEAEAWDGWLSRQGHPPLDRIGLRTEGGGWLMPITTAPEDQDEIASRIARSWAGWLRSR